jgi:hypothetical protein
MTSRQLRQLAAQLLRAVQPRMNAARRRHLEASAREFVARANARDTHARVAVDGKAGS